MEEEGESIEIEQNQTINPVYVGKITIFFIYIDCNASETYWYLHNGAIHSQRVDWHG